MYKYALPERCALLSRRGESFGVMISNWSDSRAHSIDRESAAVPPRVEARATGASFHGQGPRAMLRRGGSYHGHQRCG